MTRPSDSSDHDRVDVDGELRAGIGAVVQQRLPAALHDWSHEFVVESLVAEATARLPAAVVLEPDDIKAQFTELLNDHYMVDQEDLDTFAEQLSTRLQRVQDLLDAAEAGSSDDDEGGVGGCAMCGRQMPLTKHHLVPRERHRDLKRRGAERGRLGEVVLVCRPCHSAIHRTLDNRQLAAHYNTLEALLQVEALQRFVAWARKQRPVRAQDVTGVAKFRYRR